MEVGLFNTNGALKSDGLSPSLRKTSRKFRRDYIAFTTDGSGVEKVIFTLDFDDTNDNIMFTLLERLDHVDGLGNNDPSLDLSVYGEDTGW
ncbi:hypothetical protein O9929_20695 [Vibrio lentus]|nr:hypothetical protein [Vibrio lentus]